MTRYLLGINVTGNKCRSNVTVFPLQAGDTDPARTCYSRAPFNPHIGCRSIRGSALPHSWNSCSAAPRTHRPGAASCASVPAWKRPVPPAHQHSSCSDVFCLSGKLPKVPSRRNLIYSPILLILVSQIFSDIRLFLLIIY